MIDLAIDGKVFITNEIDAALQELDILFNTERTELINNVNYGTNFEQFLWSLNPDKQQVQKYIEEQLVNTYFFRKMSHEINVDIISGDYRNIYLVQISITDENNNVGFRQYEFR